MQCFELQVEEKTKFGRWYTPGQFPLPTDETTAKMFCTASAQLRDSGLEHYEISSYAKPGYRQATAAKCILTDIKIASLQFLHSEGTSTEVYCIRYDLKHILAWNSL